MLVAAGAAGQKLSPTFSSGPRLEHPQSERHGLISRAQFLIHTVPTTKPEGDQRNDCGHDRKHAATIRRSVKKLQRLRGVRNFEQLQGAFRSNPPHERQPVANQLRER